MTAPRTRPRIPVLRRRARRRSAAIAPPTWTYGPFFPEGELPLPPPEDPDGGTDGGTAGVREPRRPRPGPSGMAVELELPPRDPLLDLSAPR